MTDPPIQSRRVRSATLLESCLSQALRMLPIKHGAHRLLDRLMPATWVAGPSLVELPYKGRIVEMDVCDLVGWHFFILRSFDPEVTEVIERFGTADDRDVFWDIGANKGACSYEIATALPASRVVAIEPQRAFKGLLERNLAVLAPGRHEIFSVGIGETAGHFELVIPSANRGRASLVHTPQDEPRLTEWIEVVTAADAASQSRYGWPTLIKIDVEGFEPSVIQSLEPAFRCRTVRCCVFECHAGAGAGFAAIRAATEPLGYRIHAIRKTAFSTRLVPVRAPVPGSTDYAIVRADLLSRLARAGPSRTR